MKASPSHITCEPPEPLPADALGGWLLDESIEFLNHGSFGSTPRAVVTAQDRWRQIVEARPIETIDRNGEALLKEARETVGRFIGASADDFGFVANATSAINAVLRSFEPTLRPGDRIITTSHVYEGIRHAMRYVALRSGATYHEVHIPLPVQSADDIASCVIGALDGATRLVVVDHIASASAIVFPVERIIAACKERDIDILIDGAHSPGMIDFNVESIAPTYYAANLHKWAFAPRSCGVLWVSPDRQDEIQPATISNFHGQGFSREFLWQGTRDITPWLAAKDAIDIGATVGWQAIRAHNHQLATWAHAMLCERLKVPPTSPLDGAMLGSMASVQIPPAIEGRFESRETLQLAIVEQGKIEVPVFDLDGRRWVRMSCQLYNRTEQYERLAETILRL